MPMSVSMSWASAQLLAGVDAPVLAAQPLAVEQMGAGSFDAHAACGRAARSPRGRAPRRVALAQQRPRAGLDAERPVGAAGLATPSAAPAARRRAPACRCARPPRPARAAAQRRRRARADRSAARSAAQGIVVAAQAVVAGPRSPIVDGEPSPSPRSRRPPPGGPRSASWPPLRGPARRPARSAPAASTGCRSPRRRRATPRPATRPRELARRRGRRARGRRARRAARRARRLCARARPGVRRAASQPSSSQGRGRYGRPATASAARPPSGAPRPGTRAARRSSAGAPAA